jgi:hypothetical protein
VSWRTAMASWRTVLHASMYFTCTYLGERHVTTGNRETERKEMEVPRGGLGVRATWQRRQPGGHRRCRARPQPRGRDSRVWRHGSEFPGRDLGERPW